MPTTDADRAFESAERVLRAREGDEDARDSTIEDAVAMAEAVAGSGTFVVLIEMGNDAMSSPSDVSEALRDIATNLDLDRFEGPVRDGNGQTVGRWRGNG